MDGLRAGDFRAYARIHMVSQGRGKWLEGVAAGRQERDIT